MTDAPSLSELRGLDLNDVAEAMPRIRTHPGEILREDYLPALGIDVRTLATQLGMPASRLTEIIRERRGVTADTAIRLGKRFGTTPQFWINLQTGHDLSRAEAEHDYSDVLAAEAA